MRVSLETYHIKSLRMFNICSVEVYNLDHPNCEPALHQNITGEYRGAKFHLRVIGYQKEGDIGIGHIIVVPALDPIGE